MWDSAVAHLVVAVNADQFDELARWAGDHDGIAQMSGSQGLVTLFVHASSLDSYREGVLAAAEKLRSQGFTVVGLDLDLANTTDIADRTGRSRQAIRQYSEGLRGPQGFPAPLGEPGGVRVWDWGSVNEWLRTSGLGGDPEYHPTREVIADLSTALQNPMAPAR